MASTVRLFQRAEVSLDGETLSLGGEFNPLSITVDGLLHDQRHSVAAAATAKILDIDEDIASFDFLWIQSDQDIIIELVTDDDGDIGERVGTVGLLADGAFVLTTDDSYANHTVAFAAGTLDVIETIRVKNVSSDTAHVRVVAL